MTGGIRQSAICNTSGSERQLEESDAKYKFVFAHHVLGGGRGGIELANDFEWGGYGADGIVYQSVPVPADDTYTGRNKDAFLSGDILDNSGYLNVTVSPERLDINYVRTYLPHDEVDGRRHGEVAYSCTVE